VPVIVPADIVQLCVPTAVPLMAQAVSLVEKPEPEIEIVDDTSADVGLSVSEAELPLVPRVKLVEAESPSGSPVAVIVYELAASLATVNDPVNVPSDIEHDSELTGVPASEQE